MRGNKTLLLQPRPRISRILYLHKTLGDRIKVATPHTTRTLTTQPSISQALSRPHHSCQQAFSHPRSPCTETHFHKSSSIFRPRLVTLPHTNCQQTLDYTMPLVALQETRSWLQQRGLGGNLRVIDAPTHPDAQEIARKLHPDTITNNMIRAALDLKRGGEDEVEIPPHTTLKKYFGMYSISGKAYRTYGGSNKDLERSPKF